MNITKTAMITVCGRPNVGKSSLTNALVGEKIAIVSDKPQTTRNRIYGVVNRGDTQFVLLDTPGLHKPRSRLGDYMVKVVRESLSSVECALLLVEPIPHVGEPERILLQRIQEEQLPCVLCINKMTRWRGRSPCWRSSRHTMRYTTASTPSSPCPPGRATGWMSCCGSWKHTPSPAPSCSPTA